MSAADDGKALYAGATARKVQSTECDPSRYAQRMLDVIPGFYFRGTRTLKTALACFSRLRAVEGVVRVEFFSYLNFHVFAVLDSLRTHLNERPQAITMDTSFYGRLNTALPDFIPYDPSNAAKPRASKNYEKHSGTARTVNSGKGVKAQLGTGEDYGKIPVVDYVDLTGRHSAQLARQHLVCWA